MDELKKEQLEEAAEPSAETAEETVKEEAAAAAEEVVPAEMPDAEETAAEPAAEVPVEEETAAEEAPAEPAKKATPGKISLAICAVIVLVSVLIALLYSGRKQEEPAAQAPVTEPAQIVETVEATVPADGNPEDVTCKGSYSISDEEVAATADTVVATIGEHTLTNGQLQVYYWMEFQNFMSTYGNYAAYFGLDHTKPLDVQPSAMAEGLTWQQFFLQTALENWNQVQAMSLMAKNAGLKISDQDQTYLDGLDAYLEETAKGFDVSVEELMEGNFGPGATAEGYRYFQELYLNGLPYYAAEMEKMVPTQQDLESYFDAHAEEYAASGVNKDSKFVDVRHILIQVEGGTAGEDGMMTYSDEEWKACEEEAQAILDAWLAGDKTEESFAALATEKTEDPGSQQSGGLYQQVYEGQMVQPFNDWCFDAARQYGDYGLVQTSYGYHVMFFVSSEPQWPHYAESDWMNEQSAKLLDSIVAEYPMEVAYENIALGVVDLA